MQFNVFVASWNGIYKCIISDSDYDILAKDLYRMVCFSFDVSEGIGENYKDSEKFNNEIDLLKRIKNMIAISASIIIPEYEEYIEEKWSISLDLCMLIKKL